MLNENAKRGSTIFRICQSIDRIPFYYLSHNMAEIFV